MKASRAMRIALSVLAPIAFALTAQAAPSFQEISSGGGSPSRGQVGGPVVIFASGLAQLGDAVTVVGSGPVRDAAMWRREAVDAVGGYDPWVPSHDDEELAGRLRMAGYALVTLDVTAGVRHGTSRDTSGEFAERLGGGAMNGPGLVLRRARGTMAFDEHLRRYGGHLLLLLWMLVGGTAALVGREAGLGAIWAWVTLGLLAFFSVLRRGPLRAFWQGLTTLAEALGIARNLVAPIALPRVGPPPKPIAPPAPAGEPGAGAIVRAADRRPEGEPGDPPPIVRQG